MYRRKSSLKARFKYYGLARIFIKTMQDCLLLHHLQRQCVTEVEFEEETRGTEKVPEDVKEGHFAVLAARCEKPTRFVVDLGCLTNPGFLRLLEQAGEEYAFRHRGIIAIPCAPEELQKILQERRD